MFMSLKDLQFRSRQVNYVYPLFIYTRYYVVLSSIPALFEMLQNAFIRLQTPSSCFRSFKKYNGYMGTVNVLCDFPIAWHQCIVFAASFESFLRGWNVPWQSLSYYCVVCVDGWKVQIIDRNETSTVTRPLEIMQIQSWNHTIENVHKIIDDQGWTKSAFKFGQSRVLSVRLQTTCNGLFHSDLKLWRSTERRNKKGKYCVQFLSNITATESLTFSHFNGGNLVFDCKMQS